MTAHDEGRDQPAAQGEDAPHAPSDRATTFRAVTAEPEHYSGEKLLVGAYAIVWVVVFAWVAGVGKKQRSMTQRLEALEGEIARAAAARAKADGQRGAP
jgi:CcmD family protein